MRAGPRQVDEFVRTAAFLKREFEGRNNTWDFLEEDQARRVIYIFDTDVIITKCAPWITGPAGQRNGYGEIFNEDLAEIRIDRTTREKKAESVASILAEYIFVHHKQLNSAAPIFQFPAHAAETNNVYRAVRRAVETFDRIDSRAIANRRSFELSRSMALVRHRALAGARPSDARDAIDNIVAWLTEGGHRDSKRLRTLNEWDTYYRLEAQFGGIYSIANAGAFFPNEPKLSNAFAVMQEQNRTAAEEETFRKLMNYWTSILKRRQNRTNIPADAEALSYLFLANSRLVNTNWRCIFVTGDRALVREAYRPIPAASVHAKHESMIEDFSLSHIRHLWAFASDALIEPDKQQGFLDLFSGLLARWSNQLNFSVKKLEDLSNNATNTHVPPQSLQRALTQWEILTSKSITQRAFQEYEKEKPLREAIWKVVNSLVTGSWEDLQKILQEEVYRVRDRTILRMSEGGIDVIIKAKILGRRNPPELLFDSLNNTNNIFRRLSAGKGYESARAFQADLEKIKDDCHDSSTDGDDRQQSHLKFLVLGAAFASAERWLIALNHANRAIGIIERSKRLSRIPVKHDGKRGSIKSHMSGREAYFLAAVAQRMLAANDSDFHLALAYLKKAISALAEDHSHDTAQKISESRFDGERLAIALSRYYVGRSIAPQDFRNDLVSEVYRHAEHAVLLFDKWYNRLDPDSLRDVTAVNFSVNLIQTFVISEFRRMRNISGGMSCPVNADVVKAALETIRRLTDIELDGHPNRINATRLMKTYATVGHILTAETSKAELKLLQDSFVASLRNTIDESVVTHYDRWRYLALIEFVEQVSSFSRQRSIQ